MSSDLYLSSSLIFSDDKIVVSSSGIEVMMDWEHPIMSASAAYVTQGGGDILEIGFGMGISAGYIHSHSISSHTIIENHPQIIPKAVEWANSKSNVTIISQSWYDVKDTIGTFDGIFLDTFEDDNFHNFKDDFALAKAKSGAKITFWNNNNDVNQYNYDNIEFEEMAINPDDNHYMWHNDIYYMPKVSI